MHYFYAILQLKIKIQISNVSNFKTYSHYKQKGMSMYCISNYTVLIFDRIYYKFNLIGKI